MFDHPKSDIKILQCKITNCVEGEFGDRAMQSFLVEFLSLQALLAFLLGYAVRAIISHFNSAEERQHRTMYHY